MIANNHIFLLGMSGHALSVLEAFSSVGIHPQGYFDKHNNGTAILPYLGDESAEVIGEGISLTAIFFPAVGDNKLRHRLIQWIEANGLKQTIVQHASAIVSQTALIGESTFIAAGGIVNAYTKIGAGVIVNSGSIIEHECVLNDFVHVAPGAVLAGNVKVGNSSFIGANATIKQGITIGNNVVIGAGSVVLRDVPDNTVYVGNPAQFLRNNE